MSQAAPAISKNSNLSIFFFIIIIVLRHHPRQTFLTRSRVMQHLCKDYAHLLIACLKRLEMNCISLTTTFLQRTIRLWNIDLRTWTEAHFNVIFLFRLILYIKKYWNLCLCDIVDTGTHKCLCFSLKQTIAERKVNSLSPVV